jgi:hypothetical protein
MRIGRGTLDLPGGGRLTTGTIGTADPLPLANEKRTQARVLLTGVLGVERLAFQETYEAVSQSSLFRVRRSDYDPHVPSSAVYRASAFVDLSRKEVAAAVPLRPGAQHNEGSYRFAIERAGFEQERLVIRARVYRATSMFDRRPAPVFSFFVRNPGLKEALQGFESGVRATGLPFWSFDVNSGRASGFWAGAVAIRFPDWSGIVTDPITVTNSWLDGAELVIVRETVAASIPRTLEMSGVPLRPPVPLR